MTSVNSQPMNNPWSNSQNDRIEPISLSVHDLVANIKRDTITFIKTIPIITFLFASTILGVFFIDALLNFLLKLSILNSKDIWTDFAFKNLLLSPAEILKNYQVWRLFTYVYPESDVFRLIFRLIVTISLSGQFEKRTGSIKYFYLLNAFFILVPAILYLSLALVALNGSKSLPPITDEGNIFFALLVCQMREAPQSNPCEACNVSSSMYPIIIFLILSLFSSRAVITVQFFGLFMGYLYAYGMLARLMPSENFIQRSENTYLISTLRQYFPSRFIAHSERGFVRFEPTDLPHSSGSNSFSAGHQENSSRGNYSSFFGSLIAPPSQNSNNQNSNNSSAFSGQGRRLGS